MNPFFVLDFIWKSAWHLKSHFARRERVRHSQADLDFIALFLPQSTLAPLQNTSADVRLVDVLNILIVSTVCFVASFYHRFKRLLGLFFIKKAHKKQTRKAVYLKTLPIQTAGLGMWTDLLHAVLQNNRFTVNWVLHPGKQKCSRHALNLMHLNESGGSREGLKEIIGTLCTEFQQSDEEGIALSMEKRCYVICFLICSVSFTFYSNISATKP